MNQSPIRLQENKSKTHGPIILQTRVKTGAGGAAKGSKVQKARVVISSFVPHIHFVYVSDGVPGMDVKKDSDEAEADRQTEAYLVRTGSSTLL